MRRGNRRKGGKGRGPVTEENWDDRRERADRRAEGPADDAVEYSDHDYAAAGVVISVSSGRARVVQDGQESDCIVPPEVAVRQKSALAVGDRVLTDGARITAILPRRTVLARPDPLRKHLQRLIAANVDVVVHVVSVKAPPLRPRLIDRYLIAILRGGAQPVVCVNKIDLLDDDHRRQELESLEPYRGLGVPVIPCSARTGEGMDSLRAAVEGKMSALVGHSGVGKSSILNALDARLQLATNAVHKGGTGRHTTTAATLYDFGGGTYLIDTPGIREFGLWDLDRQSLREYFPEFADAAELCRFNDCVHIHEPRCAVKESVERGEINPFRYDTYRRIYEDLTA